eukprot:9482176-Pyramimonas_sp.AAC.2
MRAFAKFWWACCKRLRLWRSIASRNALGALLGLQEGSKRAPRGRQKGSKRAPRGSKRAPGGPQEGSKRSPRVVHDHAMLLGSSWASKKAPRGPPRGPKRVPRGPQQAPRGLQEDHGLHGPSKPAVSPLQSIPKVRIASSNKQQHTQTHVGGGRGATPICSTPLAVGDPPNKCSPPSELIKRRATAEGGGGE